jgi:hypothetical protein
MKPCSKNRKFIAWLALDALAPQLAQELRAHIASCEGCRRYLEEIVTVEERLTAAEIRPDIQTSESFHKRLVGRLEQPASLWERRVEQFAATRLNWRVALPVVGAAAVMIATLSVLTRQPEVPQPARAGIRAVMPPAPKSDLPPTISNYQRVANRSLDELDELLTRQGNRNSSPAPIYTASIFASANALD